MEPSNDEEDQIEKVPIDPDCLDRTIMIETCLLAETKERLIDFMKENRIALLGIQAIC